MTATEHPSVGAGFLERRPRLATALTLVLLVGVGVGVGGAIGMLLAQMVERFLAVVLGMS